MGVPRETLQSHERVSGAGQGGRTLDDAYNLEHRRSSVLSVVNVARKAPETVLRIHMAHIRRLGNCQTQSVVTGCLGDKASS